MPSLPTISDLHEAYRLWVASCTVNGEGREPSPTWSFEFSTFLQGFMFGRMTPESFTAVVDRQRAAGAHDETMHNQHEGEDG